MPAISRKCSKDFPFLAFIHASESIKDVKGGRELLQFSLQVKDADEEAIWDSTGAK